VQSFTKETINSLIEWSFATASHTGAHITRFAMYQTLRDALAAFDSPTKKALAISHSAQFGREVLGIREAQFTSVNYPESNILSLDFPDETFDFCISDQVLEHVQGNPFDAVLETARVIKIGSYICHTTCFINGVHGHPSDFWRFTPEALKLIAECSGCDVLDVGGWGNKEAWALIDAGFRFQPIPLDPNHPLHSIATRNDPEWPIVVWVIARKRDRIAVSDTGAQLAKALERIAKIERSRSWKITSPLRLLAKLVGMARGK